MPVFLVALVPVFNSAEVFVSVGPSLLCTAAQVFRTRSHQGVRRQTTIATQRTGTRLGWRCQIIGNHATSIQGIKVPWAPYLLLQVASPFAGRWCRIGSALWISSLCALCPTSSSQRWALGFACVQVRPWRGMKAVSYSHFISFLPKFLHSFIPPETCLVSWYTFCVFSLYAMWMWRVPYTMYYQKYSMYKSVQICTTLGNLMDPLAFRWGDRPLLQVVVVVSRPVWHSFHAFGCLGHHSKTSKCKCYIQNIQRKSAMKIDFVKM